MLTSAARGAAPLGALRLFCCAEAVSCGTEARCGAEDAQQSITFFWGQWLQPAFIVCDGLQCPSGGADAAGEHTSTELMANRTAMVVLTMRCRPMLMRLPLPSRR